MGRDAVERVLEEDSSPNKPVEKLEEAKPAGYHPDRDDPELAPAHHLGAPWDYKDDKA